MHSPPVGVFLVLVQMLPPETLLAMTWTGSPKLEAVSGVYMDQLTAARRCSLSNFVSSHAVSIRAYSLIRIWHGAFEAVGAAVGLRL